MNIDPLVLFRTSDGDFRIAAPLFLVALLLLPAIYLMIRKRWAERPATFLFPAVAEVREALGHRTRRFRRPVHLLRVLVLALAIMALARPQFGRVERQTYSEGIDIMLVLDVSLSMRTTDFVPDRLEAAKSVLQEFVAGRAGDRLGLVIFGSTAATIVPLTLDYGVVQSFISRVRFNLLNGETTAIGMGLATALSKLTDSEAKSKIIILLTDGENNAGNIDPIVAAEAAQASGVRVYTIGVGSEARRWTAFGPVQEAGIDEQALSQIAQMTGGLYFRATDNSKLSGIYKEIDQLEKSRVESIQFDNFNELSPYVILAALFLILLELSIGYVRLVEVP
jgi:Ca-activated chloride channel family protein